MSRANEPAAPVGADAFYQDNPEKSGAYMRSAKYRGLTIREHFAAMAMQGMCAAVTDYNGGRVIMYDEISSDAVYAADALIAALAKPVTP